MEITRKTVDDGSFFVIIKGRITAGRPEKLLSYLFLWCDHLYLTSIFVCTRCMNATREILYYLLSWRKSFHWIFMYDDYMTICYALGPHIWSYSCSQWSVYVQYCIEYGTNWALLRLLEKKNCEFHEKVSSK